MFHCSAIRIHYVASTSIESKIMLKLHRINLLRGWKGAATRVSLLKLYMRERELCDGRGVSWALLQVQLREKYLHKNKNEQIK